MAPNNPAKELIDERIVRLLGLSYDFELDYQTYIFYLKEKLVEVTSSRKKIPPEEFDLIKNEFKRVKGKTGRFTFKVKKNRINANNVSNLNSFSNKNKKLISGTQVSKDQTKQTVVGEGILDIVKSIGKTVTSIHKTLLTQSNLSKKEYESDRKNKERSRRGSREDKLEQKENGVVETAKKILAPFQSIFDRIIKFLVFTILGRAFKVFMDWAGDPKNKGKLTTIGKFLKDWWPALLGAWFLFATPLGAFTRTIIGTIAKLSFHLAKFAIPKLIKFAAANPIAAKAVAAAAVIGGGAYLANQVTGQQKAAPIQAQNKAKVQTGKTTEVRGTDTGIDKSPSVGDMGPTTPFGLLQGVNTGGIIKPLIQGVSGGGSVFSGVVDKDTGETVSGAGSDTQFLPIEGGGGAVLQRGESVLQVGARERMIRQAGVDPLAYNIGSNANKPRKINADTLASSGGLIGLSNGGIIGGSSERINLQLSDSQRQALEILGKYESKSSGGYNAVNQIGTKAGRGTSGFSGDFRKMKQHKGRSLTDLTLGEIAKLQHDDKTLSDKQWINAGKLHAVGKYQIVGNTLPELVNKLNIPNNTKFSSVTQDAMALQLMKERGIQPWIGPSDKATLAERAIIENARKEKINISRSKPTPTGKSPKPFNMFGAMGGIFNKLIGKKDGGLIKPSDGVKNPHSASDPILGALDPNEYLISKSGVRNAGGGSFERGAQFFDTLLAALDKNSNPAKQGKYNIEPPSRRNSVVTLPTISNTIGGNMGGNMNATKDRVVPGFSAISSVAQETRFRNAEIYGIG
jgi:hypothetical protein